MRPLEVKELSELDHYIMAKLELTIKNVTSNMDRLELGIASTHLYNFVYDDFCSWYLEMAKVTLNGEDEKAKETTKQVLVHVLKDIVMMIYPYTPFISEELYLQIPGHLESIMEESYPVCEEKFIDHGIIVEVETLFNFIKDVRNYKVENDLAPNAKISLYVYDPYNRYHKYIAYLKRFTFAEDIKFTSAEELKNYNVFIYNDVQFACGSNVNVEEIKAKLTKELAIVESEISRAQNMLNNQNFLTKAPASKVQLEKDKLQKYEEKRQLLNDKLQKLIKD